MSQSYRTVHADLSVLVLCTSGGTLSSWTRDEQRPPNSKQSHWKQRAMLQVQYGTVQYSRVQPYCNRTVGFSSRFVRAESSAAVSASTRSKWWPSTGRCARACCSAISRCAFVCFRIASASSVVCSLSVRFQYGYIRRQQQHPFRCSICIDVLPAFEPLGDKAPAAVALWIPRDEPQAFQFSSCVTAAATAASDSYVACLDNERRLLVGHSKVHCSTFRVPSPSNSNF